MNQKQSIQARNRRALKEFLENADADVRKEAETALKETTETIAQNIKENYFNVGLKTRKGNLLLSIQTFVKNKDNYIYSGVVSDVFKPLPKKPYSRNTDGNFKYPKQGVPYGRIIEFGTRVYSENSKIGTPGEEIRKPFFYTYWYGNKDKITETIIDRIRKAWVGSGK